MILENSKRIWNNPGAFYQVMVWFWKIGNFKIIPILAELRLPILPFFIQTYTKQTIFKVTINTNEKRLHHKHLIRFSPVSMFYFSTLLLPQILVNRYGTRFVVVYTSEVMDGDEDVTLELIVWIGGNKGIFVMLSVFVSFVEGV